MDRRDGVLRGRAAQGALTCYGGVVALAACVACGQSQGTKPVEPVVTPSFDAGRDVAAPFPTDADELPGRRGLRPRASVEQPGAQVARGRQRHDVWSSHHGRDSDSAGPAADSSKRGATGDGSALAARDWGSEQLESTPTAA